MPSHPRFREWFPYRTLHAIPLRRSALILLGVQVLTIASGGIDSVEQAGRLTDEGYDAIVLGRSLVAASGPGLIRGIVDRVGVPRSMLGWGVKAEDLVYDDRKKNLK